MKSLLRKASLYAIGMIGMLTLVSCDPTRENTDVTGVTLDKPTATLIVDESLTLVATVLPDNATEKSVEWKSSDETIATVDQQGLVIAVAPGTATVTVTTKDRGKTAECVVTVEARYVPVEGVQFDSPSITMSLRENLPLAITVSPSNATDKAATFESSDETTITVKDGVATALALTEEGKDIIITVTTTDGKKTAKCAVKVVPEVKVNYRGISLEIDDEFTLTAVMDPVIPNATIVWESSNPELATVNDGVVKGIAAGKVAINAMIDGKGATTIVMVRNIPGMRRCEPPAEGWFESLGTISFKTDRIWTVGDQEWTDVVMASNARRTTEDDVFFNGWHEWCEDPNCDHPKFYCDVRGNIAPEYGDLFSWSAAVMFRKQLCPDGWRMPDSNDFKALNIALGGEDVGPDRDYTDKEHVVINKYINEWGAEFSAVCNNRIFLNQPDVTAGYWASNERDDQQAYKIEINKAVSKVGPEYYWIKNYGMTVRCVRNIR